MKSFCYILLLFSTIWLQSACTDDPEPPASLPERILEIKRTLDLNRAERFLGVCNQNAYFVNKTYDSGLGEISSKMIIVNLLSFEVTEIPMALRGSGDEENFENLLKGLIDAKISSFKDRFYVHTGEMSPITYYFDPINLYWVVVGKAEGDAPIRYLYKMNNTAVINGKAYFLGADESDSPCLYEFDPAINAWNKLGGSAYLNDSYYFSLNNLFTMNSNLYSYGEGRFYIYSFATQSWQLEDKLSLPVCWYSDAENSVFQIEDDLYIEGYNFSMWRYNPQKNENECLHLRTDLYGYQVESFCSNGKLYYFENSYSNKKLYEYQP